MKKLFLKIMNIFKLPSQKEIDEEYLNDSSDIYDLEYRMRQLDKRKIGY